MSPLGEAFRRALEQQKKTRPEQEPREAAAGAKTGQTLAFTPPAPGGASRRPGPAGPFTKPGPPGGGPPTQPFEPAVSRATPRSGMQAVGADGELLSRASRVAAFAEGPLHPGCDELAGLRAAVFAAGLDRPPATILLASPASGAGTTAVAVGLAGELARDLSHQVLVMDADVRRPGVASMLQVDAELDLSDVLDLRADVGEAIMYSEVDNLSALVLRRNPMTGASQVTAESFSSQAAEGVFSSIWNAFAYVVIDAGATEESAAARVLAARATGAVLVLPVGVRRARARSARSSIESAGGRVLGVVLTGVSGHS